MIVAVVAALASAATFAVGSALQHRAASATDNHQVGPDTVRALLRRRFWLFGLFLSLTAVVLNQLAYQRVLLSVSAPTLDVAQVVGLLAVGLGIWRLATH